MSDEASESELVEVVPKTLSVARRINGVMWLAGVGPRPAKVMFVTPCVTDEEAAETVKVGYGKTAPRTPRMTSCAQWVILKDIALRYGVDIDQCYVTSIIKYLPENKSHRSRPTKEMVRQCMPLLEWEIEQVQPRIIVCVGKFVFDQLSTLKAKESDIMGYWDWSKQYHCFLYPTMHIAQTLKPDKHPRFEMDMRAVRNKLDNIDGKETQQLPVNITVVHNSNELEELVSRLERENAKVLSVDCEWGGQIHVDGLLRSLQIAWSPTDAAYIRFRDEDANYAFDVDYKAAGAILARWCDRDDVKYIGHHVSADLTWMAHWLGLKWYKKAIFDTEFATQCCDESLDLGLDVLALRYTDFGKYDMDLIMYRKTHPERRGTGYELVPDDILIPYGAKDVLTVYRAWPVLAGWMERQGLTKYYNEICNPFVTDVFTFWCLTGLPIKKDKLHEMRDLYNWAKVGLEERFRRMMAEESRELLLDKLTEMGAAGAYAAVEQSIASNRSNDTLKLLKDAVGPSRLAEIVPFADHMAIAAEFNIRSQPQLKRWLFDVKGYTPVKSTANKAAGVPSVDWEKVLSYPSDKQKEFTPAADKGTLEILSRRHSDPLIDALLELNAVGNLCKAFLKPADIDPDTGEIIAEKGIAYWVGSDSRIHLNHSTTETGRPRSWNPNVLNWPSWTHARVAAGMKRVLQEKKDAGELPPEFEKFVGMKKFPTIRSIVSAPPGQMVVEADYQTAEMVALAYIAGDEKLRDFIEGTDKNLALVRPDRIPDGVNAEDCVVRLSYPDHISEPYDKDKFIMTFSSDGETHATFTADDLLRDESGELVHPKNDSHWSIVEISRHTTREVMNKKKDRGAGKVVNFSSSYGGTAASIARKIEQDTGVKMATEDVQALLDAIEVRQPRATQWFKDQEELPKNSSVIRAASGRLRHLHTLSGNISGLSSRTRDGLLSALGRECRNFPIQERIGATASQACVNIVDLCLNHPELKGYPGVCLYDSIVIFCPENERSLWAKILQLYMRVRNGWAGPHDWILRLGVDTEYNSGWGTHPSQEKHDAYADDNYEPLPEELKPLEAWVDSQIEMYNADPELSVYNPWDFSFNQA